MSEGEGALRTLGAGYLVVTMDRWDEMVGAAKRVRVGGWAGEWVWA